MKKNHELRIRLSAEELESLKQKCEQAGMNVACYVRYLIRNSSVKISIE